MLISVYEHEFGVQWAKVKFFIEPRHEKVASIVR